MTKNTSRPLALFVAGLLWAGLLQGQGSVNASGGDASGSGGTVAYSVGQVVYTTNTGGNGSVAQGVQHAYEIFTLGVVKTELGISLMVFPNPTADFLTLQISDYHNDQLSYQLFDIQGKFINQGQIVGQRTQINMTGLPTATYFVKVIQGHDNVKMFKVIKK